MRRLTPCLFLGLTLLICAPQLLTGQPTPLDNNSVLQMVKWQFQDSEIIAGIGRNPTNFQLSAATIKYLKANGVSDAVLDAMFTATKKSATSPAVVPSPTIADAETKGTTAPPKPQPAATPPIIAAHTPQRLAAAKGVSPTTTPLDPFKTTCPPDNKGKTPSRSISLYFLSGTSDPTTVDDSGPVCFEVHDFNDILYTPSFTFSETVPSGNAFSDLQAAIKAVMGLTLTGNPTNAAQITKNQQNLLEAQTKGIQPTPVECPSELTSAITVAQGAAARFGTALAAIDPGKDASGNVNLVDWRTTTAKWQPAPGAYLDFQAAVSQVIAALQLPHVDVCSTQWLEAAEAIVLDVYLPARTTFSVLQGHVNSADHVVPFTSQVHATSSYTVTVTANSPQGKVTGGSVTFSLAAGRKILSTSGGFLVTEVPTPSYSSVTAPTGGMPATQNVLAVNNPSGLSVGLTALVNVYLPNIHFGDGRKLRLNGSNWGLALSAGPTYNLANGKADTTKFGLFAGPSLHIRGQFFLTPGFNLAQYSSLPLGFTKAGQVIPPNTGTPTGISHWTTRFAFALTYKIKDFGQPTTANQVVQANQAPPKKGAGGK